MTTKILILKDGRKLAYNEYGDPHGKPLIFFHGWPSSRLQGSSIHEVAEKIGVRIISPDRPGYGLSDFAPDRTLLDYVDDIEQLADQLKLKRFAVLGNSGGGPYSAACAFKIPHRLTKAGICVGLAPTNIDGILDGMGFFNKLSWGNYYRFPFLRQWAMFYFSLRSKFPEQLFLKFRSKDHKHYLLLQDITRNRNEAFRQGTKGAEWDLKLYTTDWRFDLTKIHIPVFLWYGDKDTNVSAEKMGEYYASVIPKSILKVYKNEDHFLLRRHTKEILQTLLS